MKNFTTITLSIITFTLFTQCASSQFDKKPPFTVTKAMHQEWVGGRPGSKGVLVTITLADTISNNIEFDSIYFNNKAIKLGINTADSVTVLTGNFSTKTNEGRNIIMHADPKKEMGNTPPQTSLRLPFELAEYECVISYYIKNKMHYFKLDKLAKGKPIFYQ